MKDYEVFQQKRKARQLFMALIFIAVILLGWYFPLLGFFIPLCMLLGMGIGFFRGRKWCDWYCPRGSFYDAVASSVSPKRGIPALLRNIYFRIGVLVLLMSFMLVNLARRWPGPYRIGMFFVILLSVTTLLGIILALFSHQRAWCMICPIGTIVNLIGGGKRPLKINSEMCVECKLCSKVCPVQLRPYSFKGKGTEQVREGDCLRCGSCVISCPRKALRL